MLRSAEWRNTVADDGPQHRRTAWVVGRCSAAPRNILPTTAKQQRVTAGRWPSPGLSKPRPLSAGKHCSGQRAARLCYLSERHFATPDKASVMRSRHVAALAKPLRNRLGGERLRRRIAGPPKQQTVLLALRAVIASFSRLASRRLVRSPCLAPPGLRPSPHACNMSRSMPSASALLRCRTHHPSLRAAASHRQLQFTVQSLLTQLKSYVQLSML